MLPSFVAQLGITTAAALTVAWAAVRFIGKSWVENRFKIEMADYEARKARELESLKHEQAQQIEGLKAGLDVLSGRLAKLHDQEFVVLPEVWSKMAEAMGTMIAASDPERVHPSAVGMNEGELGEYLETAPLLAWEKWIIKGIPADQQEHRDETLHNMLDWAGYRKARLLTEEFRSFLQSRRIFMPAELTSELDAVGETLDAAASEFRRFLEARQTSQPPVDLVVCPKLKSESVRMANAVQAEIRKKLYAGS